MSEHDMTIELTETFKVFVYGSLKSGFGNHRLLQDSNAEFLGTTYTKETNFLMFSFGAFPAVVKNEEFGYGSVEGELYLVDKVTLFKLDMLEGNGTFYTREKVELDDGNTAWMYLLDHPSHHMTDDDEQISMSYYDDKMVFIWQHEPTDSIINRYTTSYRAIEPKIETFDCEYDDSEKDQELDGFDADKEWADFHAKYGQNG